MEPLSPQTLITLWEEGGPLHPPARALLILGAALPGRTPGELAALSVGRRDALLLELYSCTFGPRIDSLADCRACGETLEFALDADELQGEPALPAAPELTLRSGAYTLRYRLPDGADLAAVAERWGHPSRLTEARAFLLDRTMLAAVCDGRPIAADQLTEEVCDALGAAIVAHDPQAELLLGLRCPTCGHSWQVAFDICAFLWSRLSAQARGLLREIHVLARTYGWQEETILALSPARRRSYLELTS